MPTPPSKLPQDVPADGLTPPKGAAQAAASGGGGGPDARGSGSSSVDEPTRASGSSLPSGSGIGALLEAACIGGYELHEEIHRGGQGVVYRATQLSTKRQVALKVLLEGPFAGETARRRFEREVELAASLRHPDIVTILDSGISSGCYYFAMEYIEGVRLDRALERDRPPLAQTLELLERICAAVNFAHQRGVIHRDLKPSNILVDQEGHPHVLDFGLAKGARTAGPQQSTVRALSTSGQVLGTLAYMSPEQAAGAQDVDVRSDVYSLGVVMYEALLGQPPYPVSGSLGEILNRIAKDDPTPPRALRSKSRFGRQIDDELETILLKALEKEPARRYQTAGDLAADLRHYLKREPIEAKRASGLYMLKKTVARYRWQAVAAGLMLAMLVTFLAVFAVLYTRESYARAEQQRLRQVANDQARQAERSSELALAVARELQRTLVQQKIQRGDLARARGDLLEARDRYWDAYLDELEDPAALWALRQYYLQTGDDGSQLLYVRKLGPATLSPDGRLAAACTAPDAILVRQLDGGRALAWVRTPPGTVALSVEDDGRLALAGERWAGLWEPGGTRTRALAALPPGFKPLSVHGTADGRWLLIVGNERVRCYQSDSGTLSAELELPAPPSGSPEFSAELGQLAIPTTAGVELVSVTADGELRAQRVWSDAARVPRGVRFVGRQRLAVLSDGVALAELDGAGRVRRWRQLVQAARGWELFDVEPQTEAVVFASRDGRLALYRQGALVQDRRLTYGTLELLRFARDRVGLITLDGSGSVTHWGPLARKRQRRMLREVPAVAWAVAPDQSALVFAGPRGRVTVFAPNRGSRPVSLPLPKSMRLLADKSIEDVSLAVSRDGATCVVRSGNRLWITGPGQAGDWSLRWSNPVLPLLKDVALSGDGQVLAFLAQTPSGDQQAVAFCCVEPYQPGRGPAVRNALPPVCKPVAFVGAAIRDIVFLPGSSRLLVARSNGELVIVDPNPGGDTPRPPPLPARDAAPEPFVVLDAPATSLAVDREGRWLAAACDDGVVRLRALDDGTALGQINLGQTVAAVGFSTSGDVLLVRVTDGTFSLYELRTLQRLVEWSFPADSQRPLAAWVGEEDALVLGYGGAVFEHRYATADRLIEQNRTYARQRQIARHLAEGAFGEAWAAAEVLLAENESLGREALASVLELRLRRVEADVPAEWLEAVLSDAAADTFLRIGHAAYEGGRFDLARLTLRRGRELADGEVDAYTLWDIAGCDYLADRLPRAVEAFATLVQRADLDVRDVAMAQLQRLAALTFAGRLAEANALFDRIVLVPGQGEPEDRVAMVAALVLGSYLLGHQGDSQLTANFKSLLTVFEERWLLYRDDVEFFAAEKARQRGDLAEARTRYRRCIDVARDSWPANWARYRLSQMPKRGP